VVGYFGSKAHEDVKRGHTDHFFGTTDGIAETRASGESATRGTLLGPHLSPWNIAAGQILVREAGGTVSGIEGHDDALRTANVGLMKILKPLDGAKPNLHYSNAAPAPTSSSRRCRGSTGIEICGPSTR
jgi:Inositol monophosphatase family